MASRPALRSKHRQLSEQLRQRVLIDNLVPGDRFMTVREIAREYSVSVVTAHKSVQELAAESVLSVRKPQGCFIGAAVGKLRKLATKPLITVFVGESYAPAVSELLPESFIQGMRQSIPLGRVRVEYIPAEGAVPFVESYLAAHPIRPALDVFVLRSIHASVKKLFADRNLPAVVTGNLEAGLDLPCVERDERQIACDVTRYLLARGHRRIAYVEHEAEQVAGDVLRREGFISAVGSAGIISANDNRAAERWMFRVPISEVKLVGLLRDLLRREPASDRPSAIIFGEERHAAWGLRTAHEMRVAVPGELAIVSLEGGTLCDHLVPRMTFVPRRDHDSGIAVGRFLAKLLKGEPITDRVYRIPVSLVEGETT